MSNLGPFPHGVSWSDIPTSVISPVPSYPGLNVVIGSAPIHLTQNGQQRLNKPNLYNTYEEAVMDLGYSTDWKTYDICEHMDAQFVEFGVFPVVYIPVWDPTVGKTPVAAASHTLVNGQVDLGVEMIIPSIVVTSATVKGGKKAPPPTSPPGSTSGAGGTTTPPTGGEPPPPPAPRVPGTPYVLGTDYLISISKTNTPIITRLAGGAIPTDTSDIMVAGDKPGTTPASATDIIGGIDIATGARSGLEVIEDVFQATGYVPGVIVCPKWSSDPLVASAMEAKAENINGCFSCTCLIDVDTKTVKRAQDVLTWKTGNNIVFPRQELLFGMPALTDAYGNKKIYNFASQQGPLLQWTDEYRGNGLPYQSPSNKNLRMNSLLTDNGDGTYTELPMHLVDANMLNGQGCITALNWIGGWRSWGNRTACYPSDTDVKDMFIPVRRMFDYIGNTIVLTVWQKVDEPGNRRLIDAIVNSIQLWLDGITNQEALVGARIEFRQDENPTTELLNGHYVFHVYIAVPTPAEWLDFRIEYWVPYLANLWPDSGAITGQAAA